MMMLMVCMGILEEIVVMMVFLVLDEVLFMIG